MSTNTKTTKRQKMTPQEFAQKLAEAYAATQGGSTYNYATVYEHYMEAGISEDDIDPKGNVLTDWAWRHRGRQVRQEERKAGAHCTITVWRPRDKNNKKAGCYPADCKVWHISQTEPLAATGPLGREEA